ncbi:hypothetical protein Nepgr_019633 [Nepenthes gracilis]|uniref:Uncharacterized protein n=1 Tax=Nepenthes gracilis TaxID=150966 RepID=A0AAD3SWF5_NEPGR|nr:hypothetical protein Nepgr_019633 [Nepenthes gracilis]
MLLLTGVGDGTKGLSPPQIMAGLPSSNVVVSLTGLPQVSPSGFPLFPNGGFLHGCFPSDWKRLGERMPLSAQAYVAAVAKCPCSGFDAEATAQTRMEVLKKGASGGSLKFFPPLASDGDTTVSSPLSEVISQGLC